MRYQIDRRGVVIDAGLGAFVPLNAIAGLGWDGGGYTGPQYVSRDACVQPTPSIMPVLPTPPCAECQPWPPCSPCAPWPPPGTPYYGRPDQPPLPGTVLACSGGGGCGCQAR